VPKKKLNGAPHFRLEGRRNLLGLAFSVIPQRFEELLVGPRVELLSRKREALGHERRLPRRGSP